MKIVRNLSLMIALPALVLGTAMPACEKKANAPAKPAGGSSGHAAGDGHDHTDGHDHGAGHHDGPTTQLGEQSAGGFVVKASRDGTITPGEDAAIDVWVTGGAAKVAAVRFWIGTQDAKGSVKARAEIERDNWHTHAEVPRPLPAGSKLWVEIESDKGDRWVVGFDLHL